MFYVLLIESLSAVWLISNGIL